MWQEVQTSVSFRCRERRTNLPVPVNILGSVGYLRVNHSCISVMTRAFPLQWDTRSGEIVQEYDRHLGAVNSITFIDQNRRFVSTSDDKSLRVWEW